MQFSVMLIFIENVSHKLSKIKILKEIEMIPEMSERSTKLRARVQEFMDEHIMPNESLYYQQIEEADDRWDCPPILDELKAKA